MAFVLKKTVQKEEPCRCVVGQMTRLFLCPAYKLDLFWKVGELE